MSDERAICHWCWLRPNAQPPERYPRCVECAARTADHNADRAARLERAATFVSPLPATALLVWRFDDAPLELRCLSDHGGDEDWLLYIPPGNDDRPAWAEDGCYSQFGCCSVSEHALSNGARVRIGAHA